MIDVLLIAWAVACFIYIALSIYKVVRLRREVSISRTAYNCNEKFKAGCIKVAGSMRVRK